MLKVAIRPLQARERVNRRNGYRERPFDTRTGTIALAVPKLRSGSYFPDWLLERRAAPNAPSWPWSPSATCAASQRAASTGWCKTLGIEGISKSEVSELAKSLDCRGRRLPRPAPRRRPLPLPWLDALAVKAREGGRIVRVACVVAPARQRRWPP